MTLAQLNNENEIDLDSMDLKITDLENAFNVYQDARGNWMYNLNSTVKLSVDEPLIKEYDCTYDSHWPLLAYNIYGSSRLSWMLMLLNNIDIVNVFKPVLAGQKIKYIDKEYLRTVINSLLDYSK